MKRLFAAIFIALFFPAALSAGGRKAKAGSGNAGAVNVVTTVFPSYDFVRAIAGDKVNLSLLLPPGAERLCSNKLRRSACWEKSGQAFPFLPGTFGQLLE